MGPGYTGPAGYFAGEATGASVPVGLVAVVSCWAAVCVDAGAGADAGAVPGVVGVAVDAGGSAGAGAVVAG
jgi:hypothetical protein